LAVGLGSTQPGGIITALDPGMNWARDKSLFDLAMNRMQTLVYKVRHRSAGSLSGARSATLRPWYDKTWKLNELERPE
jgi:hypothetical protein